MVDRHRVRGGRKYVAALVFVALAGLWVLIVYAATYRGLRAGDGFEYAGVARSIARGHGAVIRNLTPAALGDRSASSLPFAVHPPGWPYLIASAYWLVGPQEWVSCALSALGAWLLILVSYFWSRRLLGSRAAALTGALVAASPVLVASVGAGLSDGWYALLIVTSIALVQMAGAKRLWLAVLGGLLLGASWWIRDSTLVIAPLVILWLAVTARPRRVVALVALSTAVPMALFLLRNWLTFGTLLNPYAGVIMTPSSALVPGLSAPFRHAHPLTTTLRDVISVLVKKSVQSGGMFFTEHAAALGFIAVAAFLLYWILGRNRAFEDETSLWYLTFVIVGVSWCLGVVGQSTERYFLPALPAIALFAAVRVEQALGSVRLSRQQALKSVGSLLSIAALVLLVVVPPIQVLVEPTTASASDYAALGRFIGAKVGPDERIWSDHASAVAWSADRTSIMLPDRKSDFAALSSTYGADVLVLTSRTPEWDSGWVRSLWEADQAPDGWRLVDRFETSKLSARLYRRALR